ncbi:MAG: TonB-dependent receptor [Steroidobacteraceae bacterium]
MNFSSFARSLTALALMGVSFIALVTAAPASAQEQVRVFRIPAQALSSALLEYSRQSDVLVVVAPSLVAGKHSLCVSGAYTPSAALEKLLAGTGLKPVRAQNGGFTLTATSAKDAARDEADDDDSIISTLSEVIVTATRRAEPVSKVGEGISVVTSDQLDTLSANSLEDFVQLTPGLSMQSYGSPGYGSIQIRGISPQSVGATVAVYIDDIPFGGSSNLSEGGDFTPDLDPADIQRVEVLKGPQGTLYGATSLGGVIRYITKQPSLEHAAGNASEDVSFTEGGQPSGKVRASLSTPIIQDKLAVRVSTYYRRIGGFIDDVGVRGQDANSGYDWGVRGTLLYKPTDDLSINFNAMTQQSSVDGLDTVDLDPSTLRPLYGSLAELRYTPEEFVYRTSLGSAEVSWNARYGTLLSATSISEIRPENYQDVTVDFEPFGLGVSPSNPAGAIGHHSDQQETQEVRFTSNRIGALEFIAGTFLQHEYLTDGNLYPFYSATGEPQLQDLLGIDNKYGTLNEAALYLNATYFILPQLDLTLGSRYSRINQSRSQYYGGLLYTGSATSFLTNAQSFSASPKTYSAGLRWRMNSNVMYYLRAASGYRPGGGRTIPPGAPPGFSPDYVSDSIWSYEAGVKIRALGDRLSLDADGFWIDWTNIQSLVYIGQFNTDGNGGSARSRGLELQADYVLLRGLVVGVNAAYTAAIFTETINSFVDGERLFLVPKYTTTLTADYNFTLTHDWSADLGGDYEYIASELDTTNYLLPPYGILNLHAGAERGSYRLNLYVKNATNRRAYIGDFGYFADEPPYTVVVYRPLTVGVMFSQSF